MHTDYEDVLELPNGKELTPENLYWHAEEVIKGRWLEAEPIIMEDPTYACWYAKLIIKDRWPEAEPFIMKDPKYTYYYACEVIKDRWPEAEPIIMKKQDAWRGYCKHFGIS